MMDTNNALTNGQGASLLVGANATVYTLIRRVYQANAAKRFGAIHTEAGADK
jgi:hypothetical protein